MPIFTQTAAPGALAPATGSPAATSTWLEVVSHLEPRYGGLSSAVPALASAVTAAGRQQIGLAAFCREGEHYAPAMEREVALSYWPPSYLGWLGNGAARRGFRSLVAAADGVHIHGLWQLSTLAAARAAAAHGKPYIVSAHGMLERWALANKQLKKKIYAALSERRLLARAACLHALTEAEAEDYRRFGLRNPVAVIPNGVTVPAHVSAAEFLARFPALAGRRLVLFLGRIHYKKGLDILAEAWARVAPAFPDAHLVLAGPDFENTRASVEARLLASGVSQRVTFTGMLAGGLKWSALAAANTFVLPSYSEGLSVSVLEAMGMGKPVIVSEPCNLPEVARYGCGWTIRPETGALTGALLECLQASEGRLALIRENGVRVVRERYGWPALGGQMAAVYAWLEGVGARPATIRLATGGAA